MKAIRSVVLPANRRFFRIPPILPFRSVSSSRSTSSPTSPTTTSSTNESSQFYRILDDAHHVKHAASGDTVVGEIIDQSIDLKRVRPGETIDVPYELTINSSLRDFWQSAFYSHDRINTSTPFAREVGLQDQVIPFGLMLFLAGSMSHADHAKTQTGFSRARYHWPAFAGDTFKKRFVIMSLRSTSDGRHSIFRIHCELKNQRDKIVFSCEKTMLFPFQVLPPSAVEVGSPVDEYDNESGDGGSGNHFLTHLIKRAEVLHSLGSQTLSSLRPGQLIIHTLTRPLSETHTMQLASLARLTHERHFNTRLFRSKEELFVPGGLVLGLTTSLASRDLHEVLFEELIECSYPNNTSPGDALGSLTYIGDREEHVSGDIECLTIRTVGVKNTDVQRALKGRPLPLELFAGPFKVIRRPAALEEMLKKSCPELSKLVVCIADRKIYRLAPKHTPFLL